MPHLQAQHNKACPCLHQSIGFANEGRQLVVQNPLLVNRNQNADEVLLSVQRNQLLRGKNIQNEKLMNINYLIFFQKRETIFLRKKYYRK